ncbi:HAD family hydrolase [Pseudonocardia oroxyli]|uniref:Haloacid dehalogenase superfamily, subfamily IA, variant 3 with third motif having DD or ED/haloacid dehalogenase superfamily, subfamily IA, variant 1 with third motif having Dx(3-4)D or Dx(3-4)E n=1 Tax=Pseudonocardia oroxyli TaxID=366584 RepID=A0A1G7QVR2_PSEOR|nr:HAD-IIIA family hydrolase [Pseudonocardia oroxyli]SDG02616.1 haloacid dehalogenase superfamily, subfamily IA, variant 3 with third motif having DD or ED/haloacid dehalogenase superfamily, subfamily IA, variant 1 with third motif having Dx(3-4)D or Dx(3-4)E [Pseudonocardia oroxyli]
MTLAQLLEERRHVLLDFDGPVCAVFGIRGSAHAADAVRRALGATAWREMGDDTASYSDDPFDVLRYAWVRLDRQKADAAERALTAYEIRAVAGLSLTEGVAEAIDSLRASEHTVTIVSNNSEQAIRAFIDAHALAEQIDGVVGRTRARAQDLKPEPFLLDRALEQLAAKPADAVLVGDSITDVQAARAAGTAAIAYANKPGKDRALRSFEPDALIKSMAEIAHAA